jgi:hypothetical protein
VCFECGRKRGQLGNNAIVPSKLEWYFTTRQNEKKCLISFTAFYATKQNRVYGSISRSFAKFQTGTYNINEHIAKA